MATRSFLFRLSNKLENTLFVKTIRGGLITIIPVLMLGAFSLIGRSFPVAAYLSFIQTWAGGLLYAVFDMAYAATFGMLAVFMSAAIAISYRRENRRLAHTSHFAPPMTALICFFILSGVFTESFTIDAMGPKGMVIAIITGYLGAAGFGLAQRVMRPYRRTYADGADQLFTAAMSVILPIGLVTLVTALLNEALTLAFGAATFYQLIIDSIGVLFLNVGANFFGGLLMVLFSSLLWFFGIHGSDCLQGVMETLYVPAIQTNMDAVLAGLPPTEILTKQFFDIFVLMGGCGSAMCLLLALLIFSRRRSVRRLARVSFFPMIFNINETMIFGLPVILNPILFIPFVLTPLTCYLISYAAMSWGLVGLTAASVEWTTPVLIGGYYATRGISGSLLQLFNLGLGVLIYAPFVRALDRHKLHSAKESYSRLVEYYQERVENGGEVVLTELTSSIGETAKLLAADLSRMLEKGDFQLYYQPQYDHDGHCAGAEALLRWDHELFGMLYPPLVVKIAQETGSLLELEQAVLTRVLSQRQLIYDALGAKTVISANITVPTLTHPDFLPFLRGLAGREQVEGMCLEVTEQSALLFDQQTISILNELKQMGFLLAIDDFSMGQTSINYLKENHFDLVKLDGSLTRGMQDNPRCREIVSSIVSLSQSLGFAVLAEYVENEDQRELLAGVGCRLYQGYLYSPALPAEKLTGE